MTQMRSRATQNSATTSAFGRLLPFNSADVLCAAACCACNRALPWGWLWGRHADSTRPPPAPRCHACGGPLPGCRHHSQRTPWLRALVLGASDGLISTASLMVGVAGGTDSLATLRLAGVAGLVGGALSMAVGEFISVASQVRLLAGISCEWSATQQPVARPRLSARGSRGMHAPKPLAKRPQHHARIPAILACAA